jgi:adenylosuccinate synthase
MPGWRKSTEGTPTVEKLPTKAREYLAFVEKETGARVGMISTGPGREQTIITEEFNAALDKLRKAAVGC